MSLRWRLTLTYALMLSLTLLLAGLLSALTVRTTLYRGLDSQLKAAAQRHQIQEASQIPKLPLGPRAVLDALNRQQTIRLTEYGSQGQETGWGPSRVGFVPRIGSFQVGQERVYMQRMGTGWIQASASAQPLENDVRHILQTELLLWPVLLLLSVGGGYLLADRALRPVDQVSDLAARIARSGQPGERVPLAPGHDEISRLTFTINEMLSKLDEQLARERLFAHSSAHELRTPISVLRAASSLALEQERTPQEYRETLRQVLSVSEEMSALTERLLRLAQVTRTPHPVAVNLADVTLLASELHALDVQEKNIRLVLDIQDTSVSGDFNALVLAAGNLLQNALKYSPAGSAVHLSCHADAETARLCVQDTGPGIPPAERARLVQPFQRGSQLEQGGAGLGLALAQAVMDAHGGRLDLLDAPQGGLKAELVLPRH